MKKAYRILIIVLVILLAVGCSCSKRQDTKRTVKKDEQTVVSDQKLDGLEFVNVGVRNNVIKTVVINNTGYLYEGSKFKIKVMNGSGNVIVEVEDEVKEQIETGTTLEIDTKVDADLSEAASIEYMIIK